MELLNELVNSLYPRYGTPGSRDVEITAIRQVINEKAKEIAAAFRALEQRAEAAEALNKHLDLAVRQAEGTSEALRRELEAAEAHAAEGWRVANEVATEFDQLKSNLAKIEKQEPIGRVDRGVATDSNEYPDARVVCLHEHVGWEAFQDGCELFTHAAPAVSLAELVPDGWKLVPAEPTAGMVSAGKGGCVTSDMAREIYDDMLTAAPSPSDHL